MMDDGSWMLVVKDGRKKNYFELSRRQTKARQRKKKIIIIKPKDRKSDKTKGVEERTKKEKKEWKK